jgi:hypothetical protein
MSCRRVLSSTPLLVRGFGNRWRQRGIETYKQEIHAALRVVRGDIKRTQCPGGGGGYNWATLFLGDIKKGTGPSRLEESQMRQ